MKSPAPTFLISLLAAFLGFVPMARADEPEAAAKPRDLGPPVVDNLKQLKKVGAYPLWLDPINKRVVLVGETCKADYPLEFFVTTKSRGYESVLTIDVERREGADTIFELIRNALILCGATPGHPSYYKDGKTTVATGDEIAIEVRWKNKEGKVESTDARNWIRHVKTKQAPTVNWVFAGSGFSKLPDGREQFRANGGDFIAVLNNPIAMLDLPVVSAGAIEERSFEANLEKLPPPGTPVTIVLIPKGQAKAGGKK
jgi:hypothetical protein